jgi:signal transduction histidine kinase
LRLFNSEARYKAFFENMNEGIALLEYKIKDGRYPRLYCIEANPTFLRLIARTKEQIYEQELQDIFPGNEQVWTELSQRVVMAGESITIEQNYTPLGKIFTIDAFWTESGKFAILLMDITEKKRAEKELRDFTDRLQALSRRLLNVQEEERRHLGRELHDEIGQLLTGLKFVIEANMENILERGKPASQSALKIVNDLIVQVRELSIRLRPALLDDFGLVAALINLCDRCRKFSDLDVTLEHAGLQARLPIEIETGAYRITQEALTNIIRHAGVKRATVRVWVEDNLLKIDIKDRGKGFDVDAFLASGQTAGLAGIFERASLLNGKTVIESAAGLGTHISTWLPVELSQGDTLK